LNSCAVQYAEGIDLILRIEGGRSRVCELRSIGIFSF